MKRRRISICVLTVMVALFTQVGGSGAHLSDQVGPLGLRSQPILGLPEIAQASDSTELTLPFIPGQTWYVCQGYNTGTHLGTARFGLDLSYLPDGNKLDIDLAGPLPGGCNPATNAVSEDKPVLAPLGGRIVAVDLVHMGICLDLDNGRSMWIGHLTNPRGQHQRVERGDVLGTLAPPSVAGTGGYAHIHIQIHESRGCSPSPQIPFADSHGTRFRNSEDLYDRGEVPNQWSGQLLARTIEPASAVAEAPRNATTIDNGHNLFQETGNPNLWWESYGGGYAGHYLWTRNNQIRIDNSVYWNVEVEQPGEYEIFVHIPRRMELTTSAEYRVHHSGEPDTVVVDQAAHQGRWVSLGSFHFSGDGAESVFLADATGEDTNTKDIVFDAIAYAPKVSPFLEGPISGNATGWLRLVEQLQIREGQIRGLLETWRELERQVKACEDLEECMPSLEGNCISALQQLGFVALAIHLGSRRRRR